MDEKNELNYVEVFFLFLYSFSFLLLLTLAVIRQKCEWKGKKWLNNVCQLLLCCGKKERKKEEQEANECWPLVKEWRGWLGEWKIKFSYHKEEKEESVTFVWNLIKRGKMNITLLFCSQSLSLSLLSLSIHLSECFPFSLCCISFFSCLCPYLTLYLHLSLFQCLLSILSYLILFLSMYFTSFFPYFSLFTQVT